MSHQEIRNIIFDLGGVLIGVDVQRTIRGLEDLGLRIPEEEKVRERFMDLLRALETGSIGVEVFRSGMKEFADGDFSYGEFDRAWEAMLTDYNPDSIRFIHSLKNKYRLMLLSNTNAIHVPYFERKLEKQTGFRRMEELFEKVYYSHLVGLRKPDREIFEYVIRDSSVVPGETLFIDDREDNILAAADAGFRGHQLLDGQDLIEVLSSYSIA